MSDALQAALRWLRKEVVSRLTAFGVGLGLATLLGGTGFALYAELHGHTRPPVVPFAELPDDQARALAQRFRPLLRFDSHERWRPLQIEPFLAEDHRLGRHRLCGLPPVGGCEAVRGAQELLALASAAGSDGRAIYLDIAGQAPNGAGHHAPGLAGCPRIPAPSDCEAGAPQAIYYHVTAANGRYYVDYWWFFRFNDFRSGVTGCEGPSIAGCHDHEGDWEGVTVITDGQAAPVRLAAVAFAAHDGVYRHSREDLDELEGERPRVYVAAGSHAAYPRSCALSCTQPLVILGERLLPETRLDGGLEWERNAEADCDRPPINCLLAFPPIAALADRSWNLWGGRWGCARARECRLSGGPPSPAHQARYAAPWCRGDGRKPPVCDVPEVDSAVTGATDR